MFFESFLIHICKYTSIGPVDFVNVIFNTHLIFICDLNP